MAKVLAPHGVTINTMLPVMHHTPGIRAIYEAPAQARGTSYDIEVARMVTEAPIPAGRFGDAEDFGTLVAMFCRAQSNYVTGQSLEIGRAPGRERGRRAVWIRGGAGALKK